MKNDITAIILTKNEEANIARCMESLGDLPDRIVVVDSGSTDATVRIAQDLGAEIYYHPFKHYADQFNWALEHTEIKTTWVYRIDADEAVPPELRREIQEACSAHRNDSVNGFLMKHKLLFFAAGILILLLILTPLLGSWRCVSLCKDDHIQASLCEI